MKNIASWPRLLSAFCLSGAICVALAGCGGSTPATNTPAPTATVAVMATATQATTTDEGSATDTPDISAAPTDAPTDMTSEPTATSASASGTVIAGATVSTAGWQTIASQDNNCQIQVPADWTSTGGGGAADPMFLAIAAVVYSDQYTSLSDLKQAAPTAFEVGNIIQDTPTIYSFEYEVSSGAAGENYLAATPDNGHLCIATVSISSDNAVATLGPISRQVVGTLGVAK